ncbi:DUF305 domain-containing protein [Nocardia sputorum]|uniref:DUF305 domain-containing protein n=1 Tax=Nocardia sputorum TaxID=2984338 RepID=A0ABN6U694_9NOCA|nr:DUF305 domain-containing protein [Nocardia sputorum]BDT92068.1 DUF305 domain-containing protein [Nocardia sputorum]BDU00671.1 DUF305 domain-containing protein [Nocardia sputorum]
MPHWMRVAALTSAAFALLVLGAALRPLVFPESRSADPVLTEVEIAFAQDMTTHHQQALLMVQRLDRSIDPAIARLAEQLDRTQRLEIGTMLGWLRLADAPPGAAHPMAWMHSRDASHRHATAVAQAPPPMPGMASTAELDDLAAARGRPAEILFLQLMFRHHQGGIAMAEAADGLLRSGPVKEIARAMIHGQSQEAGVMGMLLTQRGAAPLP